jgi:phage-related protein (TIGR01555 family)
MTKKLSKLWQTMDSFTNLVAELGTGKDKRSWGAFTSRELNTVELEAMYENDWLSGKVIDIPVDDATRNWRTITAPSIGERIEEVRKAEEDLGVRVAFRDAQKWADLYKGAIIVMVTDGDTNVWEPLDPDTVKPGELKKLEVFDANEATPQIKNTNDINAPYFRQPEGYSIAGGSMIHESRVLDFTGIRLPWRLMQRRNYWGSSKLQRFYDALRNSRSVTDSIASMVYEAKLDVIMVPQLFQALASPNGVKDIIKRFRLADMVKSFNNTLLLDDKEQFTRNATQFTALPDIMQKYMLQVSAASDIPVTRLYGQSASGLNATGDGDERNYYDRIQADQESNFTPQLTPFDKVFANSVLGGMPYDWSYVWNPLRQKTEVEIADIRLKNAQRHEIDLRNDVVTPAIVARDYFDKRVYESMGEDFVKALADTDTAGFGGDE